jgi:hypothetical protein
MEKKGDFIHEIQDKLYKTEEELKFTKSELKLSL